MAVLDGIKETLNIAKDAQTLPVLRERLELAKEQLTIAEKKIADLESENTELLRENRTLRKQVDTAAKEPEYFDAGICLFKKSSDGTIARTPICQKCKLPISQNALNRATWLCTGCKAIFNHAEIQVAKSKLPAGPK